MDIISRTEAKQRGLKRYFTGCPCPQGHLDERFVSTYRCITCTYNHLKRTLEKEPERQRALAAERQRRHRAKDPEKHLALQYAWRKKNPDRVLATKQRSQRNNYESFMLSAAKSRSNKDGRGFNITIEDIVIPEKCPVLGIPLIIKPVKGMTDHAPTLDRVDCKRGYVKDNICVISWRANRIKNDATGAELQAIADYVNSWKQA